MITLLGSLLGFISSTFPDLLKLFRDASDKKHEITLLQMQIDFQAQGHQERLEEINTNADIAESEALYKTYTTGISWVDALNGTVRPVIAYSFFILYAAVKSCTTVQICLGCCGRKMTRQSSLASSAFISASVP